MLRVSLILILLQLLSQFNGAYSQETELSLRTVVIDAGHGGKDPGTSIGNLKEKDIVLEVALKTGQLIKENYKDVQVIYTREDDRFIPLKQRATIANQAKADLFISIHVNYFKGNTHGAETYILGNHRSEENLKVAQMENSVILLEEDYSTKYEGFDPNSAESYIMFELIQNEFLEQSRLFADKVQHNFVEVAKRRNRGVRQAGFLVLRETVMPSILIELGFISHEKDRSYLETTVGKNNLANAIYKAFSDYKKRFDDKSHIVTKTPLHIEVKSTTVPKPSLEEKIKTGTWHAIQIAASAKKIEENSELFKNLTELYTIKENGWYKYYAAFSQNATETLNAKKQLSNQFKGAFPVTFIDGNKVQFKP